MTRNDQKTNVAEIRGITLAGMVANVLLSVVKILAGTLSGSQALVADGLHSVSDLTTDLAILFGAGYWNEPADESHPYGHGRLETLVNIGIGAVLLLTGMGIGWHALTTMSYGAGSANSSPGWVAFIVAVFAVLVKESLFRWTVSVGRRLRSKALVSNAWHHRSDAFSSIPVAVAVLAAHLFPGLHYLDNLAALIVAVMIAKVSWNIALPSLREIMETNDDKKLAKRIIELSASCEGIGEIHAIRSRRVGRAILVDFHMLVDPEMSVRKAHDIAESFKNRLLDEALDLTDVVIHVEPMKKSS